MFRRVILIAGLALALMACDSSSPKGVTIGTGSGSATLTGDAGFVAATAGRSPYVLDDGGWDPRVLDLRITSAPATCAELVVGYPDGGEVAAADASWMQVIAWDPAGLQLNHAYASVTADQLANNLADGGGLDPSQAYFYVIRTDVTAGDAGASWYSTGGTMQLGTWTAGSVAGSLQATITLPDGGAPSDVAATFTDDCVL